MKFSIYGERVIYLDDFKSALEIFDRHPTFEVLNSRAIRASVDKLNQRSNLAISYKTIKRGRSLATLSLKFKKTLNLK
ncbi:hypothetical protein P20652_0060 [Pseudoalteromonas sp. BSi20652]|uniref:replication initiation protein n=1 Tax=Pseudoalteromonas sp. BSi20652 TaxID=388384 RepID=UPI00023190BD|nr:hypothetical protein P20652_0060 [Pseudoalteromonas sp. BSi20652]